MYFNPRPRKEGDIINPLYNKTVVISIHALVKRATGAVVLDVRKVDISIHALVKRATNMTEISPLYMANFNPRPRKEGDAILKRFVG